MRSYRNLLFILTLGTLLQGWGYETHSRINRAAAQSINGPFGEFLTIYMDTIASHAPDPDLWKKNDPNEGYRHYMDADYFSTYPFEDVPHLLNKAQEKYGEESLRSWGIAPWYINHVADSLTHLFSDRRWNDALMVMAAMGHYVADIHMPLHTVANYNGQLTGNKGVHYRWESQLVDEYVNSITVDLPVFAYKSVADEPFQIVTASYAVHDSILAADTYARAPLSSGQEDTLATYQDGQFLRVYLARLNEKSGDLVQQQLNKAARAVACFWFTCWIEAGKPDPSQSP